MKGGGLMQLIAYGAQDVYLDYNSDNDLENNNELANRFNNLQTKINWYKFERPIKPTDRNNECPITLEKINLNDSYCLCLECNYNFDAKELKIALQTHNECPMCLSEWKSTIEYINK